MIQKIKLNFTHSVNLGPIIVNIITKKKIDVPVVTKTSNLLLANSASNILVLSLSVFPFCTFLPTFRTHRATQIFFINTLNCCSLAFKLVLQNNFHGLSSTVVRLFSSQCVFLNFVLLLTASLRII